MCDKKYLEISKIIFKKIHDLAINQEQNKHLIHTC